MYDDALLELKDILIKRGCIPIAGAAFIGEHSFSRGQLAHNQPSTVNYSEFISIGFAVDSVDSMLDKVKSKNIPVHNGPLNQRLYVFSAQLCSSCLHYHTLTD